MNPEKSPRPNFFIVGAPKAGTTSLNAYLGEHPQIYTCYRKEMHYFGSDLTRIPHEFFVLDEQRYLWMFREAAGHRCIGEASVNYLMSHAAPAEIKAFSPDAKIIIMVRNPVDVLYAYHSQLLWGSHEEIADFEEALAAEPARRRGQRIPATALLPEALHYREVVKFAEQIDRYYEMFGKKNVHVIVFDDFKKDPTAEFHKTLHFLGLHLMDPPLHKFSNPNKVARIRRVQEMIQRPPLAARPFLALMPDKFRYWFLGKVSRVNTRLVPRKPLPQELRRKLTAELAGEVQSLGDLLQRDLSHWSRVQESN